MNFVKQPDGSYIEVGSISSIAGKVVDDTKDVYIPVVPPVPPEIVCSGYTTESTCTAAGCYWYDGACHSEHKVPPVPPDEIPVVPILIAVGSIIAAIGIFFAVKR